MISKIIYKMTEYFGHDSRRINHALKVYGFAKAIGGLEKVSETEQLTIELAAILHDIGIKEAERKFGSSSGKYQETEGPPIARGIMQEACVTEAVSNRVCYIIGNHHSYSKVNGIDFRILVEADFLVNIYEETLDTSIIESIKQKYFRTSAGILFLENLYK